MKMRKVAEITPEELAFALKLADAAAEGKIPLSGVGDKGVRIDNEDGTVDDITFTDTPQSRAMFAIRDQFGDRWMPVMMRAWAFAEVLDDPRMRDFVFVPEGASERKVDDSVIEIAAIMPLNPKDFFNHSTFFKRAQKRIDEVTADLQGEQPEQSTLS